MLSDNYGDSRVSTPLFTTMSTTANDLDAAEANVFAEEVKHFDSYSAASIAGCKFVNSGKQQVDPKTLKLYVSRLPSSPALGKVVGVGIQGGGTNIIPLIRLDMDNTGKGIHFNAVSLSDSEKKLAAVLTKTVSLTEAQRTTLYLDYVKALENRSAEFIWNWWKTGVAS